MILSVSWVKLNDPVTETSIAEATSKSAPKWALKLPMVTRERTFEVNGQHVSLWRDDEEPGTALIWTRNIP